MLFNCLLFLPSIFYLCTYLAISVLYNPWKHPYFRKWSHNAEKGGKRETPKILKTDVGSFCGKYGTSIVAKYLDIYIVKTSTNVYKTTFPSDMIFTKSDASISDGNFVKFTIELNIHYRACIGSFVYFLSTRVDFSFAVQKLAIFSLNTGKVYYEGLI